MNRHQAAGAVLREQYGWLMPARYSTHEQEYRAVREAAGLFDLSNSGAIHIAGTEAVTFLHNLVTNDVKGLSEGQNPGKGMAAAFLTPHGKVRALCSILALGEGYLIVNDPQTHEKVFKYIFPFSYAGDFKVVDVSDQMRIISVQGPKSLLVMKEVCFEPVPALEEHDWVRGKIAGNDVTISRVSRTGELGFDLFVPAEAIEDVWDFLLLKGAFHGLQPVGFEALDVLRIEAGKLVYGIDVDEGNMMLETGMSEAVSFTKGCYTGQEAVVMATHRGHPSKRIEGLTIDGPVPAHRDRVLRGDSEIGYITSAVTSATLGSVIALAYLKWGAAEGGTRVEIDSKAGRLPATVVDVPFYKKKE
jgi:glycine cleavage system T protein